MAAHSSDPLPPAVAGQRASAAIVPSPPRAAKIPSPRPPPSSPRPRARDPIHVVAAAAIDLMSSASGQVRRAGPYQPSCLGPTAHSSPRHAGPAGPAAPPHYRVLCATSHRRMELESPRHGRQPTNPASPSCSAAGLCCWASLPLWHTTTMCCNSCCSADPCMPSALCARASTHSSVELCLPWHCYRFCFSAPP
ncbi:hypothetical protein ZWY2020_022541 [Hordeum vulgare]|nr:hypothetical protein ZWY2020_022541 [Hordeum vulgare]